MSYRISILVFCWTPTGIFSCTLIFLSSDHRLLPLALHSGALEVLKLLLLHVLYINIKPLRCSVFMSLSIENIGQHLPFKGTPWHFIISWKKRVGRDTYRQYIKRCMSYECFRIIYFKVIWGHLKTKCFTQAVLFGESWAWSGLCKAPLQINVDAFFYKTNE